MKKFLLFIWLILTQISYSQWELCKGFNDAIISISIYGNDIFAGTNYGILHSTDLGNSWSLIYRELKNKVVNSILINNNKIFAATNGGGVLLSTDNGNNWTEINNGLSNKYVWSLVVKDSLLFAGTESGVFISSDMGNNWTEKNKGLYSYCVFTFLIRGQNIFAGSYGGVFLSSDNGNNWINKNTGFPSNPFIFIRSLVINDSNIFAGTNGEGIFNSTNLGNNWTEKNNGLNNKFVWTLTVSENKIFAGTDDGGVFLSTDMGNNWTEKNIGLSNKKVWSLANNDSIIFAGTLGGGIFRAKLSDFDIGAGSVNDIQINSLQISPNPSSDYIFIKCSDESINQNIKIFDILGNPVWQGIPEGESMRIDISSFPVGVYYVRIGNEVKMFVKN